MADRLDIRVAFQIDKGNVRGAVTVSKGTGDPGVHVFEDDAQFRRVMQEIMLEALALEPIPASRTDKDGRTSVYDDGWTAYTGALLVDTSSNAIIGEHFGNDLTQRLLQVFVGLPWARTLFQARSRYNALLSDSQHRQRKLAGLGGRSIEELERELTDVNIRITDEAARNRSSEELVEAQRLFDETAQQVHDFRDRLNAAIEDSEEAGRSRLRAEKALLMLQEERAAAAFFGRLSPKCCPRCSAVISEERRKLEMAERKCSVCSEKAPEPNEAAVKAEIALAHSRLVDAKGLEEDAIGAAKSTERQLAERRMALQRAGARLQALSASGTAAELQLLQRRRDRLEGMLEVATAITRADLVDTDEIEVLDAATKEAAHRVSEVADAVFARASDEITRIVRRLGMRDVESIVLKRNAHVSVMKGGSESTWGGLSAGEQLRLRIATVIALVRTAREYQTGRHPGLLLVDSPGKEEVADANLAEMIHELKEVATGTAGLQLFVALKGQPGLFGNMDSGRLRSAAAREYLW